MTVSLPTAYQQVIHKTRYARWIDEENRREDWDETVSRYVDYICSAVEKYNNYKVDEVLKKKIYNYIIDTKVMPSMRGLMTAGPALERDNTALYNCAYLPVDSLRSFDETMYILMCGTGVGYSVETKYVNQLPTINEHFEDSSTVIVVDDSKAGWAKAFRELVALLYQGQVPSWDFSKVRPAGARLKTFGGRASGPEPLERLFNFTTDIIRNAAGRKLTSLEAHDIMCKVAEVVVVGGVRRSAMISLSDLEDRNMAAAKSGSWWEYNGQRALANNSAVYESRPSMEVFMAEWKSLYDSKSGERGIFSRDAARRVASVNGRRDVGYEFGTNPCCVSPNTILMTTDGPQRIDSLENKPFTAIVNGKEYPAPRGSWISGESETIKVKLTSGHEIVLTPEHRILTKSGWKEAQHLVENDFVILHNHDNVSAWSGYGSHGEGYLLGLFVGDGNFIYPREGSAGEVKLWKNDNIENQMEYSYSQASLIPHRSDWSGWRERSEYFTMSIGKLPLEYGMDYQQKGVNEKIELASYDFQTGFLSGYFDADGHIEGNDVKGYSVRLSSISYENLQAVQRMLGRLGIMSVIRMQKKSGTSILPDGRGGSKEFNTQTCWRLIISSSNIKRFYDHIGFKNSKKQQKLEEIVNRINFYNKEFVSKVESIVPHVKMQVWDAEVSDVHAFDANGIYAHNSEIILRPFEFCNLTEVVVREEDTLEDLLDKVEVATILGTLQSTFTRFKYLRKQWQKNCEEERLLGVSLTGQFGHMVLNGSKGIEELSSWLTQMREKSVEVNKKYAQDLGINQSVAITCVKPSGTVSQLVNCSSGMHPWHNEFYARTIRADNKDPVTNLLKDFGVMNEPDVMKPSDTTVFTFPIKAPDASLTRKDLTAIQHLELWLVYQRNWTEHKPSITVSVKESEWMEVGAWVYEHIDELSGVSFLPYSEHTYQQAPYQDITESEYNELLEKTPATIDWNWLSYYETSDGTTGSQELACNSDLGCEVVDINSA